LLHTTPQNDLEVGFNSGIITVMKLLGDVNTTASDLPELHKLKDAIGNMAIFNMLSEKNIVEIIACKTDDKKLMGVKLLKEATGYDLMKAKDVMVDFYAR